jgi:hypothetical protein
MSSISSIILAEEIQRQGRERGTVPGAPLAIDGINGDYVDTR